MKTKETNSTRPGSPTPCKQVLSMLLLEQPKFSVPFVWITSAKNPLERKRKICRYFVNGTIQCNSCFDAKKLPVTENFHRNFRINGKRWRLKGPTWPAWVSCEPAITNKSHSKYFLTNRQRQDKTGILFFLTCFVPALFYRCLHPGLTSDLTSFSP